MIIYDRKSYCLRSNSVSMAVDCLVMTIVHIRLKRIAGEVVRDFVRGNQWHNVKNSLLKHSQETTSL